MSTTSPVPHCAVTNIWQSFTKSKSGRVVVPEADTVRDDKFVFVR
ncbi:hypothetical protein GECvBGOT_gp167 [Salmonella phage GEC_vB_GOT]|nr:hypothetical protein GECvBGOT_gp167 [Salmonella phage GEC_vB_GOT]